MALSRRRERALLAILLLNANRSVSAEELIEGLWEDPPRTARTAMHGLVGGLRRALGGVAGSDGEEVLTLTPSGYLLHVEEFDLVRFEGLVAEAKRLRRGVERGEAVVRLEQAEQLWRGPPLADVAREPFARGHIPQLEESRLAAIEERIELELELGHHARVLGELSGLVAREPLREGLRGRLMLALYRAGRQADALEVFRNGRKIVVEQLGIEPGPRLRELETAILVHDPGLHRTAGTSAAEPSPAKAPERLAVPSRPTRLIGREHELAELRALLEHDDTRLVTLTGPGGIGKTRLALAAADSVAPRFRDGAAVVYLAGVEDPNLLLSTIAQRLGLAEREEPLLDQLTAVLAAREMLLVLDNFEQLLAAVPAVSALVDAAPRLKLLVSSRVVLRASSEREFQVPPLSLPTRGSGAEELTESAAVRLFVERAGKVLGAFTPTPQELATVAEICRQLDGLPLALELAVARLHVLSIGQLRDRLAPSLPLLTGGPRDAPERHQTLRATLDSSYRLLEPLAQQIFGQLGVFVGGFTLEGALAVCTRTGQAETELLDALATLREHHLLMRRAGAQGEPRFSMLEVVREYARDLLAAAPDADMAHARHAEFCAALAEQAEMALIGPGQLRWLEQLEVEIDNLRAAMAWALGERQPDLALRIIGSSRRFWWIRGRVREAQRWLDQALAAAPDEPSASRARALSAAAAISDILAQRDRARDFGDQALAMARRLDDDLIFYSAAMNRAAVATAEGDLVMAAGLYEESAARGARAGLSSVQGDATMQLGAVALERGEYARAAELARYGIQLLKQDGSPEVTGYALVVLAEALISDGRHDDAVAPLSEAASLILAVDDRGQLPVGWLGAAAAILIARADYERAARILGLLETVCHATGYVPQNVEARLVAHTLEQVKAALPPAEFQLAQHSGAGLSAEDAFAQALEALGTSAV